MALLAFLRKIQMARTARARVPAAPRSVFALSSQPEWVWGTAVVCAAAVAARAREASAVMVFFI